MLKRLKKLEKLYKYLIAAILLVVPLYPKFPFIRVPGTFVSIRIEDFIILITAVIILFKLIANFRKHFQDKMKTPPAQRLGESSSVAVLLKTSWSGASSTTSLRGCGIRLAAGGINQAILLFIATGAVSLLSAIFITKTVVLHIGFLHLIRRIEYFIPFILGTVAVVDRKNLEFYLKVLMISVVFIFIYGIGQKYLQWPVIVTQNQEYSKGVALRYIPGGHINSTFAGHYDLSTFLVMTLPIFISLLAVLMKKPKNLATKFSLFAVSVMAVWLLAMSGSRISVASYLLSAMLALIFIKKYKFIPIMITVSLIIFSFSPSLRSRYTRLFDVTTDKLKTLDSKLLNNNNFANLIVYASDKPSESIMIRRELPTPTPTPPPVFEDRSTNSSG